MYRAALASEGDVLPIHQWLAQSAMISSDIVCNFNDVNVTMAERPCIALRKGTYPIDGYR